MPLQKLGGAREIQSGWNKMQVGPVLERDRRTPHEERVCGVAQGIYYGQRSTPTKGLLTEWNVNTTPQKSTPAKGPKQRNVSTSSLNISSQQHKSSNRGAQNARVRSCPLYFGSSSSIIGGQNAGVKSSPLYFGSSSVVIERDDKAMKTWKRRQDNAIDSWEWDKRHGQSSCK